jgi:hypothetical protein
MMAASYNTLVVEKKSWRPNNRTVAEALPHLESKLLEAKTWLLYFTGSWTVGEVDFGISICYIKI